MRVDEGTVKPRQKHNVSDLSCAVVNRGIKEASRASKRAAGYFNRLNLARAWLTLRNHSGFQIDRENDRCWVWPDVIVVPYFVCFERGMRAKWVILPKHRMLDASFVNVLFKVLIRTLFDRYEQHSVVLKSLKFDG